MKNLFAKVLLSSLTVASSLQLFAAPITNENIKTNVVYTVNDTAEGASEADLEKLYSEKCFDVLATYFNITRDQLPKDAVFSVFIMNKESLDKDEAHWLALCEQEYADKKITQQEYTEQKSRLKKEYDNYRNRVAAAHHDIVECQYHFDYTSPNGFYGIRFNANTKEPEMVLLPLSKEGWELQTAVVDGKKAAPVSKVSDETKTTNAITFIKAHQLGGITNPKLVKIMGSTHNRLYFQDAADPSKKALLMLDPITFQVYLFDCGTAASELS